MCVLIGNTVKTRVAEYPCGSREEAEALFLSLKQREEELAWRANEQNRLEAARRAAGRRRVKP